MLAFLSDLTPVQRVGLAGAVLAAAGLLVAQLSETWFGLVPCALCLLERWPYRAAVLLAALSLASPRGARLLVLLAGLSMLGGAAIGTVHVGVEQGWWPSPLPECSAPSLSGVSVADRLARMPAQPAKPCDEPTFLVPGLPLSMAAMNLALSLLLGIAMAGAAVNAKLTAMREAR